MSLLPASWSARQGHTESLSALYDRYLPGIFGYIATRVPDRSTAEDLTSEVFLQMVEGIHQFRAKDEAGFLAWLSRIPRMVIAGYYRKREKQPAFVSLPTDTWEETQRGQMVLTAHHPDSDPTAWTEAREDWGAVVQAMNQLAEEQRQVLAYRLIQGHDVATVARFMGKKENAIKALQFRALQRLRRLLERQQKQQRVHPIRKEEKTKEKVR